MEEVSAGGIVANIAGGLTLGAILEYFGMDSEVILILTAVLILDWIFGSVNAYIQGNLQSKVMVTGLVKKLTRWLLPFIVIIVLKGAGFEEVELVSTCILSILIVAEGYSIIGHIYSINYKEQLPEIDALKILINKIAELFKGQLNKKEPLDKKDDEQA